MRATWRKLPAARYEVGFEAGIAVPATDGVTLVTDHYFPRGEGEFPTLLVRSPYGRGIPWSPLYGVLFAEQGFHVVVQSCRGTGGSGGTFHYWRNEPADGQATVAWLRQQDWFNGVLGTAGPSYLGYVQWALALDPPPELKAMAVQVGLHDPHAFFHTDGILHLESPLASSMGVENQHRGVVPFLRATLRLQRHVRRIVSARPLRRAYEPALGQVPWLDDAMTHSDPADPYWSGADLAEAAERATVPTSLVAGWHDVFADQTLAQYARLRKAGCDAALLVGPWTHTSALQQGWTDVFTETLAWLRAHLCDDPSTLRPSAVRIHRGGDGEWLDLDGWPGEGIRVGSWFPDACGRLLGEAPTGDEPLVSFRYDPSDPTPSVGGPLLSPGGGSRDQKALEARDDVLTFDGPVLTGAVDVLGAVFARVRVSTDTGHADLFARLCDVDADGRSVNVCDGIAAVRTEGDAPAAVDVAMSSTAYRFAVGHRIRLQVSGGAHPRFARSSGTDALPLDAVDFRPVRLTLHSGTVLELPLPSPARPQVPPPGEESLPREPVR
ncbi:CocE/NonD family hydrolase [Streptomyces sp. NBC_00237]|uniref:CocE/NonD family hydrolase n=1 Tax=Streptomyces sp. NBC_00237 TaxID=2975687 RepID=UPI00225A62B5|nr:CocE/NonD family hydrolase [Streptomyces sp. NBC_00237]MCX5205163.1 CocE/NonD family hydrolase [Streptomyces sp. NBC_00237]